MRLAVSSYRKKVGFDVDVENQEARPATPCSPRRPTALLCHHAPQPCRAALSAAASPTPLRCAAPRGLAAPKAAASDKFHSVFGVSGQEVEAELRAGLQLMETGRLEQAAAVFAAILAREKHPRSRQPVLLVGQSWLPGAGRPGIRGCLVPCTPLPMGWRGPASQDKAPVMSEAGGQARLQLAVCCDSLNRPDEARKLYQVRARGPSPGPPALLLRQPRRRM